MRFLEASVDSDARAHSVPERGGEAGWSLLPSGISFDAEGSTLPAPAGVTQVTTSTGPPFLLRKCFCHLINIFFTLTD